MSPEFSYQIHISNDWETDESLFFSDAIEAVNTWNKFIDSGNAINERTISFIPPRGEIAIKTFYAK